MAAPFRGYSFRVWSVDQDFVDATRSLATIDVRGPFFRCVIKRPACFGDVVIATQAIGHLPRLAGSGSIAPFGAASEETATIDRDNNLPAAAQVANHLPDRIRAAVSTGGKQRLTDRGRVTGTDPFFPLLKQFDAESGTGGTATASCGTGVAHTNRDAGNVQGVGKIDDKGVGVMAVELQHTGWIPISEFARNRFGK